MSIALTAERRETRTKGELRLLRASGKVPAVVYGKQLSEPALLALEEKELLHLLRSHPNAVLELNTPETGKQPVMIADVQREPLSRRVRHVDLLQIDMNEEVRAHVRIEIVGEANGVTVGGILQSIVHELEVECLPAAIPEHIEINVADLEMGDSLLVRDIRPPAGITITTDPELVVVTVLVPQKDLTAEEAEAQEVELHEAQSRSTEAHMHEIEKA
ncbi:50S ribosomal protein L25 [Paenibacillus sp. NPDC058071]|uniref:50S ribosomal protein L25 n=1 Tax=Paenibacillus sp. NPDC058071 TaxID=3346326 RepID=UPI0036DBD39E